MVASTVPEVTDEAAVVTRCRAGHSLHAGLHSEGTLYVTGTGTPGGFRLGLQDHSPVLAV